MKVSYRATGQTSFRLLDAAKAGARRGLFTFWTLTKIMVPVFVAVYLLRQTPVFVQIADFFRPYMGLLGLPGDVALAVVLGNMMNLYSAIAVLASLELSWQKLTVAAVFLGVSHSHPMEGAIMYKMRTRFFAIILLRVMVGFLLAWVMKLFLL